MYTVEGGDHSMPWRGIMPPHVARAPLDGALAAMSCQVMPWHRMRQVMPVRYLHAVILHVIVVRCHEHHIHLGIQMSGGNKTNKPIQDGGEAKAPLWLNRLSGTN